MYLWCFDTVCIRVVRAESGNDKQAWNQSVLAGLICTSRDALCASILKVELWSGRWVIVLAQAVWHAWWTIWYTYDLSYLSHILHVSHRCHNMSYLSHISLLVIKYSMPSFHWVRKQALNPFDHPSFVGARSCLFSFIFFSQKKLNPSPVPPQLILYARSQWMQSECIIPASSIHATESDFKSSSSSSLSWLLEAFTHPRVGMCGQLVYHQLISILIWG